MAYKTFRMILSMAALLTVCLAAPTSKAALEPKEDLKTDSTYGFGYAYPFFGFGGYYPYYGYGLGYYGYGYPKYYYGSYPYHYY